VDHPDLERVYSAKTNDELIALAAQRRSLEPDAQTVLWTELRRRKLTDSHLLRPSAAYKTPSQNLSFNLPAKAGAVVILLVLGAFGLTLGIAAAREHQFFNLALIFVLFWGPILAAIAWGTQRALRNRPHSSSRNQRHEQEKTLD
jgi:hypothetical protein